MPLAYVSERVAARPVGGATGPQYFVGETLLTPEGTIGMLPSAIVQVELEGAEP